MLRRRNDKVESVCGDKKSMEEYLRSETDPTWLLKEYINQKIGKFLS